MPNRIPVNKRSSGMDWTISEVAGHVNTDSKGYLVGDPEYFDLLDREIPRTREKE
jgi:hypothetical protein